MTDNEKRMLREAYTLLWFTEIALGKFPQLICDSDKPQEMKQLLCDQGKPLFMATLTALYLFAVIPFEKFDSSSAAIKAIDAKLQSIATCSEGVSLRRLRNAISHARVEMINDELVFTDQRKNGSNKIEFEIGQSDLLALTQEIFCTVVAPQLT